MSQIVRLHKWTSSWLSVRIWGFAASTLHSFIRFVRPWGILWVTRTPLWFMSPSLAVPGRRWVEHSHVEVGQVQIVAVGLAEWCEKEGRCCNDFRWFHSRFNQSGFFLNQNSGTGDWKLQSPDTVSSYWSSFTNIQRERERDRIGALYIPRLGLWTNSSLRQGVF